MCYVVEVKQYVGFNMITSCAQILFPSHHSRNVLLCMRNSNGDAGKRF